MASMPGYHITKGPFAYLDQMFDGTNPGNYAAALATIGSPGGLLGAAGARVGPAEFACFRDDWLGNPAWNQRKPNETLREGLIAAINAAMQPNPANPKPMEFFWVCAREHTFQVYFCDRPRQVTVFIFTDPPKDPIPQQFGGLTTGEGIFVVKAPSWENNPVPGGGPPYPSPITQLPAANPVVIMREVWR